MNYSVVICTLNGEIFVGEQVRSIVTQLPPPNKILISDDGSSDATLEIIKAIETEVNSTKFEYISGPRRGATRNFLNALNYIDDEYIFLSDQDDVWATDKLNYYTNAISNEKPDLLFSDASLIDESGQLLEDSFIQKMGLDPELMNHNGIIFENCVQGATICLSRNLKNSVCDSLQYVNINRVVMHDWYIAIIAKYFFSYKFIDLPLLHYRQHENNEIGANKNITRSIKVLLLKIYQFYEITRYLKVKGIELYLHDLKSSGFNGYLYKALFYLKYH